MRKQKPFTPNTVMFRVVGDKIEEIEVYRTAKQVQTPWNIRESKGTYVYTPDHKIEGRWLGRQSIPDLYESKALCLWFIKGEIKRVNQEIRALQKKKERLLQTLAEHDIYDED